MDKLFCFAQSMSSGKILGVFHDRRDSRWVVNFKKSIASAFQANYEGTAVTNETDSQSNHKSHYRYYSEGYNWQIQERRIDRRDISTFAGKTESTDSTSSLYFHEHDKLELDNEKRIQFSKGKAVLELGPDPEEKVSTASNKNDNDKGIPALGAVSDYYLKLSRCTAQTDEKEVAEATAALASPESMSDGLLASMDEDKANEEEMQELIEHLPSFEETVKRVQRDFKSEETFKLISDWRRLLELESKKGPLSGTKAKLPLLLQRLEELQGQQDESSSGERMLIYHLLSSEGSLTSQQALVDSLDSASESSSEVTSLSVEIALLPRVDSTTLGRHENVKEKIVDYLSKKLSSTKTQEETSLFIHALGNTGSRRIIPLLLPFLSDPVNEGYCVDALRAVSMDQRVEKGFAAIISEVDPKLVLEVVESLLFPFKNSIYSSKIEEDLLVSEELKGSLIEAGIEYNDQDLTKALLQYFNTIEDEASSEKLRQGIEDKESASRRKRSTSAYWPSTWDKKFNLIASLSQRSSDARTYPYNKAYMWTKQVGYSKIHANVAAGGFGGAGESGIKLYARARVDLVAWSKTYIALDIIFSYVKTFPSKSRSSALTYRRYIKIVEYTLVNELRTRTSTYASNSVYKYSQSWYRSYQIFKSSFSFYIYVGTLRLTLSSRIALHTSFKAYVPRMDNIQDMKAAAELRTGPTLTISGQAAARILEVFEIGLTASGSISYHLTPEASTSVCGRASSKGDANACFEVYSTTSGNISVAAYWKRRHLKCKWRWGVPRCTARWGSKKKFASLSHTWNLHNTRKKLNGECKVYWNSNINRICKEITNRG
uniref:Vitellogenin domain-containing protein n=2 Tax=Amphimedon queenslandica TaxID=400682 RepID=A0A1X7TWI0_AMPQE